jgi:hypothetical protein
VKSRRLPWASKVGDKKYLQNVHVKNFRKRPLLKLGIGDIIKLNIDIERYET